MNIDMYHHRAMVSHYAPIDYIESVVESFTDDFYEDYEDYEDDIEDEESQISEWIETLMDRGREPKQAATIIERTTKLYKL